MNTEVHALGKKLNIDRFLFDMTDTQKEEEILDNYQFAYSDLFKIEHFTQHAIVATVISPGDDSHDFMHIALTMTG